jgi:hypothetical protein
MGDRHLHVKDAQLLLFAAGDLAANEHAALQTHLEACPLCRARLDELHDAEARFSQVHSKTWNQPFPPIDGARAALKSRITGLERERSTSIWTGDWKAFVKPQTAAVAGLVMLACLLVAIRMRTATHEANSTLASLGHGEEPDSQLTPGAALPVTREEVCGSTRSGPASEIPISMKQTVLKLYGLSPAQSAGYELDYLITPELGGATDVRNLWPEPYDNVWNAHVKDQLEDRLHQMVCSGDVDLATAQHDIATDWIAAYHKYFHTESPVSKGSIL